MEEGVNGFEPIEGSDPFCLEEGFAFSPAEW
jgi:hypothetical protein